MVWEAAKVADPDECARVGALAHERDPEKYPCTHLTELTKANYVAGNPLYDILHDGRTSFDGPPLLSLKTMEHSLRPTVGTAVTEWHVDMPRLTSMPYCLGLAQITAFVGELPNLGIATWTFSDTSMTSWRVDLPSMTYGHYAFGRNRLLTHFEGVLSSVSVASSMFCGCPLRVFRVNSLAKLTDGSRMFS